MSNSEWNSFKNRITDTLLSQKINLGSNTQAWVIGVSGGADSMALLHILAELHPKLIVAHVNYHKRGIDSDSDEQFVKKWAEMYQLPFFSRDGSMLDDGNFQEKAREFRYAFFMELKEQFNASHIVTAHHANDLAENVLFRTLRGSSAQAILSENLQNDFLLRPFISVSSDQIKEILKLGELTWREDSSNSKTDYTRNWLRNKVIPELSKRIPQWSDHLIEKAKLEQDLTEELSKVYEKKIYQEETSVKVDLNVVNMLNERVLKALLFKKFSNLKWNLTSQSIEQALTLKTHQKGKRIQLSEQIFALKTSEYLVFYEETDERKTFFYINNLQLDEVISMNEFTIAVCKKNELKSLVNNSILQMDFETLKFPLTLRTWENGDRMQPLGFKKGTKLISDIITESKIDLLKKNSVCVLLDDQKVILGVSFPEKYERFNKISEQVKVQSDTKNVLQIRRK
jgi:tRNA(Ile)-lysidine synthase